MVDNGAYVNLEAGTGFFLICDHCEEVLDGFESWDEAVEYKKDKANGWRTIKDKDNDWCDLCPQCNKGGIIAGLKGKMPEPIQDTRIISHLADLAVKDYRGF